MIFFSFDSYGLLSALLVIFAIQLLLFLFAAFFKTDKLTDLSYGGTVLILTLVYLFVNTLNWQQYLLLIAASLWAVRISGYLFYRILKIGKDHRFDQRRENFWSFAAFWNLQAMTIFIISLPLILAIHNTQISTLPNIPNKAITALGILVFSFGLVYESIADWQKFQFRLNSQNKDKFIQSGLWRFSRHPNYFGEILVWIGLFLISVPLLHFWQYFSVISPLFISILLLKISGIPLLQAANRERYGSQVEYQNYEKSTNLLIPNFALRK